MKKEKVLNDTEAVKKIDRRIDHDYDKEKDLNETEAMNNCRLRTFQCNVRIERVCVRVDVDP